MQRKGKRGKKEGGKEEEGYRKEIKTMLVMPQTV